MFCTAVNAFASDHTTYLNQPEAVILDNSYTPVHAAPVFCNVANIRADGYTPLNRKPIQALRDDAENLDVSLDAPAAPESCTACGGNTLYSFAKGYYETAVCGHKIYFKGAACSNLTNCGFTRVDEWILEDECTDSKS